MRETKFIEQNKAKWEELERLLQTPERDPEKLNELFVQVSDDLSFSKTFYPNRSVRVYLNSLSQKIFSIIYTSRKTDRNRVIAFWTDELPQLIYESRFEFRLSFIVFILSMLIGAWSGATDPEFLRVILGEDYVNMTLQNIEKGDPMAVYKSSGPLGMWLGITANNIWVAFLTFATGVFYGVGTIWVLIQNGIMVGSFQYFFVKHNLFQESFLTIWMHGTLEISAIIIAGAAGLTMGKGLVFPGTYSRLKAFQVSARRGLRIMIGITPVVVLAAFIEGFFTRFTEVPDVIRLIFILTCLGSVLAYFVWYPVRKARQGFGENSNRNALTYEKKRQIDYNALQPIGGIFSDVFLFYKNNFRNLFKASLAAAGTWCLLVFGVVPPGEFNNINLVTGGFLSSITSLGKYFIHENLVFLPLINGFVFSIPAYVTCLLMLRDSTGKGEGKWSWWEYLLDYLKIVVPVTGLAAILATNDVLAFLLMLTAFPIVMLWIYVLMAGDKNLVKSMGKTLMLAGTDFWRMMGLYAVLFFTGMFFMMIFDTSIFSMFRSIVDFNFYEDSGGFLENFYTISTAFMIVAALCLIFTLLLLGKCLLYYTLIEIREAVDLKDRISEIGMNKKLRGMDWEGYEE